MNHNQGTNLPWTIDPLHGANRRETMVERKEGTQSVCEGRTVDHSKVTLSQVIMPAQSGPGGVYAHGGEIIKMMDTAAGLAALKHAHTPVVTLRVEGINFLHPIRVGNYVAVDAKLTFTSQSTMEIQVRVTAEDVTGEKQWEALTAYFIFVALHKDGTPAKIPPLIIQNDEEQQRFEAGKERYSTCRIDDHFRTLCALE